MQIQATNRRLSDLARSASMRNSGHGAKVVVLWIVRVRVVKESRERFSRTLEFTLHGVTSSLFKNLSRTLTAKAVFQCLPLDVSESVFS